MGARHAVMAWLVLGGFLLAPVLAFASLFGQGTGVCCFRVAWQLGSLAAWQLDTQVCFCLCPKAKRPRTDVNCNFMTRGLLSYGF